MYKVSIEESFTSLFKGLTPAMHRLFFNCSISYGLYEPVRNAVSGPLAPGEYAPFHKKILAALITGTAAISVANPSDVVKVRMQSLS